MLGKGQPGGSQCVAHALGALIAVGDGVAQTLAVLVQQHKVHRPGVNADGGGGVARVVGGFQAVENLPRQGFDVPAKVTVLAVHAVFKAVDLPQYQLALLHRAHDVPPAGRADIHCQSTGLHNSLLFGKIMVAGSFPPPFLTIV